MRRQDFTRDGITLSYLDNGGDGEPIIALHALWMEAGTYRETACRLFPRWRVIALDQRGHGYSGHPMRYTADAMIDDIGALIDHLGIDRPVILMGNSMGATNAFRFAARHPDKVRALINEEGPAEEQNDLGFVRAWGGIFATREELADKIGERLFWSVEPSLRHTPKGWTLVYSPEEILEIAAAFNGDWWSDWLATTCPALVIRGTDSRAVGGSVMETMASRRPNSRLAALDAGHVAHEENADAFLAAVEPFLDGLNRDGKNSS